MTTVTAPEAAGAGIARRGGRLGMRWGGQRRGGSHQVGESFLNFVAVHALAIALALMFLAPFGFILLTAVMTDRQSLTSDYWPNVWEWSNYVNVFRLQPVFQWLLNTLMYSGIATVAMICSSLPVAYGLARFRFKGRRVAFLLVISMMMLPPQVIIVPMYVLWTKLGLTGTLWPLIIPNFFGDAFSIFLLRQFLLSIPHDYSDAARIDGCNEFRVLTRVIAPMAKPAIAATAMFGFFLTWNDYFGPLLYTSENQGNWTLSLGLASFRSIRTVQWNLTMAVTVLCMLPVIVVFFLAQRTFVKGITLTGVKG